MNSGLRSAKGSFYKYTSPTLTSVQLLAKFTCTPPTIYLVDKKLSSNCVGHSYCLYIFFYRPQRSWGKVIFSQASVILFTGGGGLPQCMLGYNPPWDQAGTLLGPGMHPPEQASTPLGPGTPTPQGPGRYPLPPPPGTRQAPLGQAGTPLGPGTPQDQAGTPQSRAYRDTRPTSGRFASYWNVILFNWISTSTMRVCGSSCFQLVSMWGFSLIRLA